jgi:CubicO group peptidase (beta-lactamase class C family)
MRHRLTSFVPFLFLLVPIKSQAQEVEFPAATPASAGLDSALLARADSVADRDLPALLSLAILRADKLAFERYWHGADRGTVFNVKSVSKSILSALIGIAVRDGFIPTLDRPVAEILPEYFTRPPAPPNLAFGPAIARMDSARRLLTVRHLLTMTLGMAWQENGPLTNAFLSSSNYVRFAAELPMEEAPGTRFHYNTAGTHLLSAVLQRSTGMPNPRFGEEHLFGPAGFTLRGWSVDPQGVAIGGAEMFFTARDLLRFGQLYLHRGKLHGRQIVPADWVERSWARQVPVEDRNYLAMVPGLDGYGYLWWRRSVRGTPVYCGLGLGGQFVLVVPSLDLVAAGGSALDGRNPGTPKQFEGIFRIFDDYVLRAAGR